MIKKIAPQVFGIFLLVILWFVVLKPRMDKQLQQPVVARQEQKDDYNYLMWMWLWVASTGGK